MYQSESETDVDLEFYDKIQRFKRNKDSKVHRPQNANTLQVEFADFLEPHLIKTGHIIPLSSGHNNGFTKTELTLYEIHLTNAGFISEIEQMIGEDLNKTGEGMLLDDDEEEVHVEVE